MNISADDSQERAWVCRVQEHDDREAFGQLVRCHQGSVRGLLRRLTGGDVALADELAQECFLSAYQAIVSFRGDARFKTWLYRIAYNGFLQKRRASAARAVTKALDERFEPGMAPGDLANDVALRLDMQAALRSLSEPEQAAISCCYTADLSHAEAAEVLGWPLGTLKTHVLRGKVKLRIALAAWDPGRANEEHAA